MRERLKNITTIQTGTFARTGSAGTVVYLQVRHFAENGDLVSELHPDLCEDDVSKRHLLMKGDILFAAKGAKNFAAVYSNDKPAVASTSFFFLRIVPKWKEKVLPGYITWYLNQNTVIKELKMQAIGSAMPSISKTVLDETELPIPDIAIQTKILKIFELRKKEKNLTNRLESLRDKIIEQLVLTTINKDQWQQ